MAYVYDDEACPRRFLETHVNNGRGKCGECGETVYSARLRDSMAAVPKPSKARCQFSACDTPVTIRCWVRAVATLNLPIVDHEIWPTLYQQLPTTVLEDDSEETWLCFQHDALVKLAGKRRNPLAIRRSVEGWLWIDNLDHLRFAS